MRRFTCIVALGLCGLTGCGESLRHETLPPAGRVQSAAVRFTVVVPKKPAQSARRPSYVSPSTRYALIVDTTASSGSSTTRVSCNPDCTAEIQAPVGVNTFAISLQDISGTLLSSGSITTTIVVNQENDVSITFNPIVKSIALPNLSAAPGSPKALAVSVTALDPDGNTIVGPGTFQDASGNPIVITVTDIDPKGATTLIGSTISGPNDVLTLNYNGAAHTTTVITGNTSTGLAVGSGAFSSVSNPRVYPYAGSGQPTTMTIGPDAAIWAAGWATTGYDVVRLAADGTQTPYHFLATNQPFAVSVALGGIATGADGNLWLTLAIGPGEVARVTPAGIATTFTDPSFSFLQGIALGPDGNVWLADRLNASIDRITPTGQVTAFSTRTQPPQAPNGPQAVVFGANGTLYYTNNYTGGIDTFDTTTATHVEYAPTGGVRAQELVRGADGNIWFAGFSPSQNDVGFMTMGGTFTIFPLPVGVAPKGIAAGADGNVWFADGSFGLRWVTPDGHIGAAPIAGVGAGISALIVAPDGSFWIVVYDVHNAASFVHLDF